MIAPGVHRGLVVSFERERGLGEVRIDPSGAVLAFHCIDIADGSRDIGVDTAVEFEVRRKLGGLEAVAIRPG